MKPLKAVNLSLGGHNSYLACPYCLSEVTVQGNAPRTEVRVNVGGQQIGKNELASEKPTPQPTDIRCTHHFGYLSERSSAESIPDECMVCTRIVDCMLKAVKK